MYDINDILQINVQSLQKYCLHFSYPKANIVHFREPIVLHQIFCF